jgi:phosphatidate phosphatase PAH1
VLPFLDRTPFGDLRTRAWVHLWGAHDRVVVSDIDGTMTRSDVIGYIDTVQLRKYDYTHAGICRLYSHLAATHEVRFVYLTSRPISMLEPTRAYIEGCRQQGQALPPGPIFTSTGTLTQVRPHLYIYIYICLFEYIIMLYNIYIYICVCE